MKHFLLVISLAFILPSPVFAWRAAQNGPGSVIFAKWELNGRPVWTDAQRDELIVASLQFSSSVVTVLDFTPNLPTADEIALSSTVYNAAWDGNILSAEGLRVEDVRKLLTDKKAIRATVAELQRQFDSEVTISSDFAESGSLSKIQWYKSCKEFAKRRYQSLP